MTTRILTDVTREAEAALALAIDRIMEARAIAQARSTNEQLTDAARAEGRLMRSALANCEDLARRAWSVLL